MAVLGQAILAYYTTEAIMCRHPRLPTAILNAALDAYQGPATLASITREWGVEPAAAPGGEVDPGYLQFARVEAGNASVLGTGLQVKDLRHQTTTRYHTDPRSRGENFAQTTSNKTYKAQPVAASPPSDASSKPDNDSDIPSSLDPFDEPIQHSGPKPITLQAASTIFVHSLFGAQYLHAGLPATKAFFTAHIDSRHLDFSSLFAFDQPTRDLSRLCARENFIPPVARILAETGRLSRHPVYVVGVFSGREKLGEGSGPNLNEARSRASINALKGWYLYSPLEVRVPSQAKEGKKWEPVLVDGGEVVV